MTLRSAALTYTRQLIVCSACGAAAALGFGWVMGRTEWFGSISGSLFTATVMLIIKPQDILEGKTDPSAQQNP
jgi:hypothetical protein